MSSSVVSRGLLAQHQRPWFVIVLELRSSINLALHSLTCILLRCLKARSV